MILFRLIPTGDFLRFDRLFIFEKASGITMRSWSHIIVSTLLSAFLMISTPCSADNMDDGSDNAASGDLNAARDLNIRGWLRLSRHNPEVINIYMEISNEGKEAFLITGIRSDSCPSIYGVNFDQDDTEQAAEMFTHFTIPRKMTLVFPRGGYHLVCRGFQPEKGAPRQVTLDFRFLTGGKKHVVLNMNDKGF